jgi:hypothetical protein
VPNQHHSQSRWISTKNKQEDERNASKKISRFSRFSCFFLFTIAA